METDSTYSWQVKFASWNEVVKATRGSRDDIHTILQGPHLVLGTVSSNQQ